MLHDDINGRRLRLTGPELQGNDRGSLGNAVCLYQVLYPEGIFHAAGDLLELEHVHFGKGQQQYEKTHQYGGQIGKGRHPGRGARRSSLALFGHYSSFDRLLSAR